MRFAALAASQLASLEINRIETQLGLQRNRLANLEITSPIDGVVLDGKLKESIGSRVKLGQVICEVAPLEDFVVEIAVPDEDIAYVHPQ